MATSTFIDWQPISSLWTVCSASHICPGVSRDEGLLGQPKKLSPQYHSFCFLIVSMFAF